VLHESEHVLPDESSDGTGAVDRNQYCPIRSEDKTRRVEKSPALRFHPIESAENTRGFLNWESEGHGERETPLGHGSTSVFDCVARSG